MKSIFTRRGLSLLGLGLLFGVSVAQAATVSVSTSDHQLTPGVDNQGWWSTGNTGPSPQKNDTYLTGRSGTFNYRSYFFFDLSAISGTVTGATFEVARYTSSSGATLGLFDVSTPVTQLIANRQPLANNVNIWNDLGSGVSYGGSTIGTGAYADNLSFTLNADALAAINAKVGNGWFSLGAAVMNPFSQSKVMFQQNAGYGDPGISNGASNRIQRLVLTVDPVAAIPEPSTYALMMAGLLVVGWVARRRSTPLR